MDSINARLELVLAIHLGFRLGIPQQQSMQQGS